MADLGNLLGVPVHVPTPPDFHFCNPLYGSDLDIYDCLRAVEQLPKGHLPMPFQEGSVHSSHGLPILVSGGKYQQYCGLNDVPKLIYV